MINSSTFSKGIGYIIFSLLLLFILIKTSNIDGKYTFKFNGNWGFRILNMVLTGTIIGLILIFNFSKY
jgi:hypothetical protein